MNFIYWKKINQDTKGNQSRIYIPAKDSTWIANEYYGPVNVDGREKQLKWLQRTDASPKYNRLSQGMGKQCNATLGWDKQAVQCGIQGGREGYKWGKGRGWNTPLTQLITTHQLPSSAPKAEKAMNSSRRSDSGFWIALVCWWEKIQGSTDNRENAPHSWGSLYC